MKLLKETMNNSVAKLFSGINGVTPTVVRGRYDDANETTNALIFKDHSYSTVSVFGRWEHAYKDSNNIGTFERVSTQEVLDWVKDIQKTNPEIIEEIFNSMLPEDAVEVFDGYYIIDEVYGTVFEYNGLYNNKIALAKIVSYSQKGKFYYASLTNYKKYNASHLGNLYTTKKGLLEAADDSIRHSIKRITRDKNFTVKIVNLYKKSLDTIKQLRSNL